MLDFLNLRNETIDGALYVSVDDLATHLAGSVLAIQRDLHKEINERQVGNEELAYADGIHSALLMLIKILQSEKHLDAVLDDILKSS